MDTTFYRDLAYVFAAAVVGGYVAKVLRQPLILGYLLGGILIGPFTPGPTVSQIHEFERLAEIGVILLMYSIGLEFSFRELWQVRRVAVLGGIVGILLSVGLGLLIGRALGWTMPQGAAIGAVVSVASTMVLSRILIDRDDLRSPHGKVMIGITLMEDLAVVVLTVLLPALSNIAGNLLAVAVAVGKAILILVPVGIVAAKLVPWIMTRVARTGNEELYLLVILAIGFLTAALTQMLGLSLALGAFLAGLIVSESDTSQATAKRLLPLRDAFVAMFFVTMGALVDPGVLLHQPLLWIVILGLTVVGKLAIWTLVVRLFGYTWRTAIMVGAGLTQIGEFSYVLVRVARDAQLVGDPVYHAVLAASVVSILVNGVLVKAAPMLLRSRRVPA